MRIGCRAGADFVEPDIADRRSARSSIASRFASSCSALLAPTKTVATVGRWSSQASATCAWLAPVSRATSPRQSMMSSSWLPAGRAPACRFAAMRCHRQAAAAIFARQQTARQRPPDQAGDILIGAQRMQLPFAIAHRQRIGQLVRNEARQIEAIRSGERFHQLPAGIVGTADIANLARADQPVERRQGLFDRGAAIEAVDLEQVDIVSAEPPEAALAGCDQMMACRPGIVRARADAQPGLGGDQHLAAPLAQRLAEHFFGTAP